MPWEETRWLQTEIGGYQLCQTPDTTAKSDLVITEVNIQTLVSWTVNGKSVNRVLLDTGAEWTLVDSSLIQEKDKTGEIIRARSSMVPFQLYLLPMSEYKLVNTEMTSQ